MDFFRIASHFDEKKLFYAICDNGKIFFAYLRSLFGT